MKKVIGSKIYKSNGKFYEFYQFDDLPKSVQKELLDSATDENSNADTTKLDVECDQYLHIQNCWHSVSDFLTTYHNPWLGKFADEYHNNNIHGLLLNDYDIAIELNNSNDSYRSWIA